MVRCFAVDKKKGQRSNVVVSGQRDTNGRVGLAAVIMVVSRWWRICLWITVSRLYSLEQRLFIVFCSRSTNANLMGKYRAL